LPSIIDIRALSSAGGTTLTQIATAAAGDAQQSIAGSPVQGNKATMTPALIGWGGMTTIADTIRELQLVDTDQVDSKNAEYFVPGASSILGYAHRWTQLPYQGSVRQIFMRQNTGAANNLGYTMDMYPAPPGQGRVPISRFLPNQVEVTQAGNAITAVTWNTATTLAPTNPIIDGLWAILGLTVSALTNYAIVRFNHTSFGSFRPGIPVVDETNTLGDASNNAAQAPLYRDPFFLHQGYQFVYLSEILGQSVIPVFKAANGATGLEIDAIAITADTPIFTLRLAKVG
jgi:hypothetical protein